MVMKLKTVFIVLLSFMSDSALAKLSCDIYIQTSAFERSQQSFDNISRFFGFTNGKKEFDVSLNKATETQYWTSEDGKKLEQINPVVSYKGKSATIELNRNIKGEWSFKWTVSDQGLYANAKINEIIFESRTSSKKPIPDFAMTENSELIMTRSMTRKNPNSNVVIVIKHTLVFSKNPDGTLEMINFHSTDSVRGNTILVGEETDYRLKLTER